jgi:hypothetical protein
MDHVTDADLEQDFGIKVRLHRVKIIEGIKKLQTGGPAQAEPLGINDLQMSQTEDQDREMHRNRNAGRVAPTE